MRSLRGGVFREIVRFRLLIFRRASGLAAALGGVSLVDISGNLFFTGLDFSVALGSAEGSVGGSFEAVFCGLLVGS